MTENAAFENQLNLEPQCTQQTITKTRGLSCFVIDHLVELYLTHEFTDLICLDKLK